MEICLKLNPDIEKIGNIPFLIVYHGRSDVDENMMGIKLSLLPALYNIKDRKIIGGISLLNADKSIPVQLCTDSFFNECYSPDHTVFEFNNRGVFEGDLAELEESYLDDLKSITVRDNDNNYREAIISYDVLENNVIITIPVYMNDDVDVKSYVENKLKDIKELFN